MKWEPHYTGISVAQVAGWWGDVYLQRDTKDWRLRFVRYSFPKWPLLRYGMLGVFFGRTNHLFRGNGWEVFTRKIHFGWIKRCAWREPILSWSGSTVEPHAAYTIRLGRFFVGSETDKWLKVLVKRYQDRKFAAWAEAYDKAYPISPEDEEEYREETLGHVLTRRA